jgi:hypothetical protein
MAFNKKSSPGAICLACIAVCLMGGEFSGAAADARLNITNKHSYMEVHFVTPIESTRKYYLQYSNSLPCSACIGNLAATNWSNLYTGYSFPFTEQHYFIPDSVTNKSRFYRLLITP